MTNPQNRDQGQQGGTAQPNDPSGRPKQQDQQQQDDRKRQQDQQQDDRKRQQDQKGGQADRPRQPGEPR